MYIYRRAIEPLGKLAPRFFLLLLLRTLLFGEAAAAAGIASRLQRVYRVSRPQLDAAFLFSFLPYHNASI